MFAAHVPERYRDQAPRVVEEPRRIAPVVLRRPARPEPRAERGRRQDARDVQRRSDAIRGDAARLLRRARAGARHVGRRPARGIELPELDRLLRPGAQLRARSRGQPRDDQGVQRLARRRVVRRRIPIGSSRAGSCRSSTCTKPRPRCTRLAAKGCHAVTFSENPAGLGMPSIHSGEWDPLFAACCDVGTVLCCHVGSSSKSASTAPDAPAPVPMSLSSVMAIYTLGDLLWADFWHRFPALRFALTEGDIGWIPYFLQRAEHTLDRHNGWMRHDAPQGLSPSELFRERILCCFIEDRVGVQLLDHFNVDNVCWESDYPHSDSSWPDAPERLERCSPASTARWSTRSRTATRCATSSSTRSRHARASAARPGPCAPEAARRRHRHAGRPARRRARPRDLAHAYQPAPSKSSRRRE